MGYFDGIGYRWQSRGGYYYLYMDSESYMKVQSYIDNGGFWIFHEFGILRIFVIFLILQLYYNHQIPLTILFVNNTYRKTAIALGNYGELIKYVF